MPVLQKQHRLPGELFGSDLVARRECMVRIECDEKRVVQDDEVIEIGVIDRQRHQPDVDLAPGQRGHQLWCLHLAEMGLHFRMAVP